MTKLKFYIVRFSKLIITAPIWLPLLTLGVIAYLIGFVWVLIQGIGRSIKSGGKSMDEFLLNNLAHDGSWCDKIADWVNK